MLFRWHDLAGVGLCQSGDLQYFTHRFLHSFLTPARPHYPLFHRVRIIVAGLIRKISVSLLRSTAGPGTATSEDPTAGSSVCSSDESPMATPRRPQLVTMYLIDSVSLP
jgi:hypothetical protein